MKDLKILVIDDMKIWIDCMRLALIRLGVSKGNIHTAIDKEEFEKKSKFDDKKNIHYNLVITDFYIEGNFTGKDVIKKIQEIDKKVKVIVWTTAKSEEVLDKIGYEKNITILNKKTDLNNFKGYIYNLLSNFNKEDNKHKKSEQNEYSSQQDKYHRNRG